MIPASGDFIRAMQSSSKILHIKLEIYDSQMNYIKELTQSVIKDSIGEISTDLDRPVRRSFYFSLDNSNGDYTWSNQSLIWIDKRIRLYLGLELPNGQIDYVLQGTFIMSEPEDSHTSDGKRTNISGQDLAYLLTDKRGKFINETTIETGTNAATAIRLIAQGANISQFNFDTVTETIPYELTFSSGESRWQAIKDIADLAKCDVYFDVNGYLRLKKIDLNQYQTEPSVWSFKSGDRFYAGNVRRMDETDLCNHVVVLGGNGESATARYELIVTESDPLWANNPYSIEKIGNIIYQHSDGNLDPLITTNDEVKWRAKYELMQRLGFTERLSLSLSPHYLLEAGDVIEIEDSENNVIGKYLITSLSIPINPSIMTVDCLKYQLLLDDWNFL